MPDSQNPADKQAPNSGKVANDSNKQGEKGPTQLNQGHRTSDRCNDRDSNIGSNNQSQSRRGVGEGNNR